MKPLSVMLFVFVPLVALASYAQTEDLRPRQPIKLLPAKPPVKSPAQPQVRQGRTSAENEAAARAETIDQINLIDYANKSLGFLRAKQESCIDCFAWSAGQEGSANESTPSQKQCREKWTKFYDRPVIDVNFVFGYVDSDQDGVTTDIIGRQVMADKITAPCAADQTVQACGFKQSEMDSDVFEKEVFDPDDKPKMMRLRLTASSASASARINELFKSEQDEASQKAKEAFFGGLETSKMLLYIGHARGGGGPDFEPAWRNEKGMIDYERYRSEKPGLRKLLDALAASKKGPPDIMGFLACDSGAWHDELSAKAPKSGLLLSQAKTTGYRVGVAQAFIALDSVIWQRCGKAFDDAMSQVNSYGGQPVLPPKLRNFYDAKKR